MTPLRDKAIAAVARDLCPREDVCAYCLQSAEMAVDALLAAGLLGAGPSSFVFPWNDVLANEGDQWKTIARAALAAADQEDTDG